MSKLPGCSANLNNPQKQYWFCDQKLDDQSQKSVAKLSNPQVAYKIRKHFFVFLTVFAKFKQLFDSAKPVYFHNHFRGVLLVICTASALFPGCIELATRKLGKQSSMR